MTASINHILPDVLSSIVVSATLGIASAIITESALSFLGLGFPSDFLTWGRLLFDGANFLQLTPLRLLWPGLAISLTVLILNLIDSQTRLTKRFGKRRVDAPRPYEDF